MPLQDAAVRVLFALWSCRAPLPMNTFCYLGPMLALFCLGLWVFGVWPIPISILRCLSWQCLRWLMVGGSASRTHLTVKLMKQDTGRLSLWLWFVGLSIAGQPDIKFRCKFGVFSPLFWRFLRPFRRRRWTRCRPLWWRHGSQHVPAVSVIHGNSLPLGSCRRLSSIFSSCFRQPPLGCNWEAAEGVHWLWLGSGWPKPKPDSHIFWDMQSIPTVFMGDDHNTIDNI